MISIQMNLFWYIVVGMNLMEGNEDLFAELRTKFVTTLKSGMAFWIPAQAVNFLFIPHSYRILYIAMCSFAWLQILCFIKRKKI